MVKNSYFVTEEDYDESGCAIVAESHYQAKKLYAKTEYCNSRITDLLCRKQPTVKVDDLEIGHVLKEIEGLDRGAYGWVEETECPVCELEGELTKRQGVVSCSNCHEKANRDEE